MNTTELQVTVIVTIYYEHGMHNTTQHRQDTQPNNQQEKNPRKQGYRHEILRENKKTHTFS